MGINYSLLQTTSLTVNIKNGVGGRLGVTGNYHFNSIFSLSPKLELAMNGGEIVFKDENISKENYSPFPLTSELALHATFTSNKGNFLPFFSFGPSLKIPISKDNNPLVSDYCLSADVCVGFKKGLELFNSFQS